jgi:hypothetical protein
VLENRVLTSILGPKEDEVAGGWRKVSNEEFHNLYPSPYIIRMIKSRNIGWDGHITVFLRSFKKRLFKILSHK